MFWIGLPINIDWLDLCVASRISLEILPDVDVMALVRD